MTGSERSAVTGKHSTAFLSSNSEIFFSWHFLFGSQYNFPFLNKCWPVHHLPGLARPLPYWWGSPQEFRYGGSAPIASFLCVFEYRRLCFAQTASTCWPLCRSRNSPTVAPRGSLCTSTSFSWWSKASWLQLDMPHVFQPRQRNVALGSYFRLPQ